LEETRRPSDWEDGEGQRGGGTMPGWGRLGTGSTPTVKCEGCVGFSLGFIEKELK
jgi:hypothetical protein